MKRVVSWLPRPSKQYHRGGAWARSGCSVAAVRSVVVVAQRARSDGSTVCRRGRSRGAAHGALPGLRSAGGTSRRPTPALWDQPMTYTNSYQAWGPVPTGPGGPQGQRGRSPDPIHLQVNRRREKGYITAVYTAVQLYTHCELLRTGNF